MLIIRNVDEDNPIIVARRRLWPSRFGGNRMMMMLMVKCSKCKMKAKAHNAKFVQQSREGGFRTIGCAWAGVEGGGG